MTFEEAFVEQALSHVGCHYIWAAKGLKICTLQGLVPHKFTELDDITKPLYVVDCSGLITDALFMASQGRMDFRGTHGSKMILDTFPLANLSNEDGVINCYAGHVSINLGRGRVVESAGGDESTTSIRAAIERGAKVRVGRDLRNPKHLLGLVRIPLDKSELRGV